MVPGNGRVAAKGAARLREAEAIHRGPSPPESARMRREPAAGGGCTMGMALIGPEGDCHFNITAWSMLLDLAVQYGWKPAGVLEPKPQEEDEPPAVEVTACEELPADSPLAGAISSMFPSEEEEPNLTRYFF